MKENNLILEMIKEVNSFSFGEKGTLRFFPDNFQKGYQKALEDISHLIETGHFETKNPKEIQDLIRK